MNTTIIPTVVLALFATPILAAESAFERDLKQLTEQREKALAAAVDPINRRYQTSLEQLLQRATQAKDLDAAVKIRETLANGSGSAVPGDNSKPKLSKAALERQLNKTAWRETANGWVSDLRFDDDKMIVLPRSGGQRPVTFRVGNDGCIKFTWDGKAQSITVSEDLTSLTWGTYVFQKQ